MTVKEKRYYMNKEYVGYYSGLGGIEIKEIQYGIEDYVIYVANAWYVNKSVYRARIRYGKRPYFMYDGHRIYFDECIRKGA